MSPTPLYYPGHMLPVGWLRKYLLFEDQVARIVPSNHRYSDEPEFLRLRECLPDAIVDIPSSTEIAEFDHHELELFERAFRNIQANDPALRPGRTVISIGCDDDGGIVHPGYVRLHRSKVSQSVLALLNKYRMGPADFEDLKNKLMTMEKDRDPRDWLEVKAEASHLILSGLAARVAWTHGYGPVTSSPLDYSLVALNALGYDRRSGSLPGPSSHCMLASSVVSTLIPESIEEIPTEVYLELRKEFSDVREPFRRLIMESDVAADLRGAADAEILRQRLEATAHDVSTRIEKVRQRRRFAQIEQWTPFAMLSLITFASVLSQDFKLTLALAGATVSIGVIEKVMRPMDVRDPDAVKVAGKLAGLKRDLSEQVERSVGTLL